ncbi:unnamed protein product [Nippostrongylus brasiliensis]|uniref:Uncharacterized protein n=1 Tax=Nippostrongylus brasiliensis TaxID=27835 RepID=A0A0N4YFP1_NIPBR|nr:unnamed protein product [Nippostrongylus brasiliensis]
MTCARKISHLSPVVSLIIDLLERAPVTSLFVPVAWHGTRVGPARSDNTKSIESIVQTFDEEVRSAQRWATWCSSGIQSVVALVQRSSRNRIYMSAPPDLRQLGPCDCVSDLRLPTKLGAPYAVSRQDETSHSEHPPLYTSLRDANRMFILLNA